MRPSPSVPLLAAIAVALAAAPAWGAEGAAAADTSPQPKFEVMGPAACAQWPKSGAISSAGKAVPLNWTLGFLSGWAALGNLKLLDVIDAEAVAKWMDDYCAANPTVTLPLAARQLERELEARLPAPPPPPAPPSLPAPPAAEPTASAGAAAAPAKAKPPAARRTPARKAPARARPAAR